MIERKEGWEKIFEARVKETLDEEFKYGKHDCCLAVADIVLAMTGIDFAKGFRRYKTAKGAQRFIIKHGDVSGILKHIMHEHNVPEVPVKMAKRGAPVVAIDSDGQEVLGIVDLSGYRILMAADFGWETYPLTAAIRAWDL